MPPVAVLVTVTVAALAGGLSRRMVRLRVDNILRRQVGGIDGEGQRGGGSRGIVLGEGGAVQAAFKVKAPGVEVADGELRIVPGREDSGGAQAQICLLLGI